MICPRFLPSSYDAPAVSNVGLLHTITATRASLFFLPCSLLFFALQKPQELSEDNWRNIFATNVDGVFHTVRAAYPLLKQSKHSKVVITSSVAALYGYGPQAAYCASKVCCLGVR